MDEKPIMPAAETAPQEETAGAATAAAEPTDEAGQTPDTTPAAETEEAVPAGGTPLTIPIQYNHESRELTLDEARDLAQKGLKFDELTPTLEKMRFLAAANGKSLPDLVDALVESQDKQLYQSLLDECDGNEAIARRLYEAEKAERQSRYETARQAETAAQQKEREALTERLAAEFLELQKEFPDVQAFGELPPPVVETAVRKGIPLMDAYLRHQHREQRKITAARSAQAAAQKASAGAQSAGMEEAANPAIDAMMAGIWRT